MTIVCKDVCDDVWKAPGDFSDCVPVPGLCVADVLWSERFRWFSTWRTYHLLHPWVLVSFATHWRQCSSWCERHFLVWFCIPTNTQSQEAEIEEWGEEKREQASTSCHYILQCQIAVEQNDGTHSSCEIRQRFPPKHLVWQSHGWHESTGSDIDGFTTIHFDRDRGKWRKVLGGPLLWKSDHDVVNLVLRYRQKLKAEKKGEKNKLEKLNSGLLTTRKSWGVVSSQCSLTVVPGMTSWLRLSLTTYGFVRTVP